MARRARILVIKHSAFGDFILSTGSFKAIRAHHAADDITLLTTAPFKALARSAPYFNAIWIDPRPTWRTPGAWLRMVRRLRAAGFDRVYDLQRNDRTASYFRALWPHRPDWVGVTPGCSHGYVKPAAPTHIAEREAAQLALAGIIAEPVPDVAWLGAETVPPLDIDGMVLLVPGGAAHRPEKRWPAAGYGQLAQQLAVAGRTPVLIGGDAEADARATITSACPAAIDLGGKTDIAQIAALARRAVGAVGNDTGPMHVIAAAGCPSVSLFGPASDPALIGPRGPRVTVLRQDPLDSLPVDRVQAALDALAGSEAAPA